MSVAADSIRTCAGCGQQVHPGEMERFVFVPEMGVLHDLRGRAPGRGAHVHADSDCLLAAARGGFRRIFKANALPADEPAVFARQVHESIAQRVHETARVAVRSQQAAVGQNAVAEVMKAGGIDILFIASDAGNAARKKFGSNAERKNVETFDRFTGKQLGGWTAKEFVTVLGVTGTLAERLKRDCQTLERVGFFGG